MKEPNFPDTLPPYHTEVNDEVSSSATKLDLAFLRVASDLRISLLHAVRERLQARLVRIDNEQHAQVIIAEFINQIKNEEKVLEVVCQHFAEGGANEFRPTPIEQRLIDARELYEHFFDGEYAWRVDGWSDSSVTIAADLYSRSPLEIAVTVWHYDRICAEEAQGPLPTVTAPQVEFDHRLLGSGKHVLLSTKICEHEPFFEMQYPVIGVCGVNRAWMFLNPQVVDKFGSNIVDYMMAHVKQSANWLMNVDPPLANRPLGFKATRYAAEAFVRHLTIAESARLIFDRVASTIDMQKERANAFSPSRELEDYISQVLETGCLSWPAYFDASTAQANASALAIRIRESFLRRENVFEAWTRYVDYAKSCGVWVQEWAIECDYIRSLFESKFPGEIFTATDLRISISELRRDLTIHETFEKVIKQRAQSSNASSDSSHRVIRVSGGSSPAILISKRSG